MHWGSEGFLGNVAWECQIAWGAKLFCDTNFQTGRAGFVIHQEKVLERMLGSHVVPG